MLLSENKRASRRTIYSELEIPSEAFIYNGIADQFDAKTTTWRITNL